MPSPGEATQNQNEHEHENCKEAGHTTVLRRYIYGNGWGRYIGTRFLLVESQSVFGDEGFFIQPEEPGYGTNESAIEDAAGQDFPAFILQCIQKPGRNSRCSADFVERDAAHFPLSFQVIAEAGFAHYQSAGREGIAIVGGMEKRVKSAGAETQGSASEGCWGPWPWQHGNTIVETALHAISGDAYNVSISQ